MRVLKKITVKAVLGKKPALADIVANGGTLPLMRVIGVAEKIVSRESPYAGDDGSKTSYGFKGQFKASRLSDGEEFLSQLMFAPGIITDTLSMALQDPKAERVEFAFVVGVTVSPRDAEKYEYTVEPLVSPVLADPFEALETKAGLRALKAFEGAEKAVGNASDEAALAEAVVEATADTVPETPQKTRRRA